MTVLPRSPPLSLRHRGAASSVVPLAAGRAALLIAGASCGLDAGRAAALARTTQRITIAASATPVTWRMLLDGRLDGDPALTACS